MIRRPVHLIYFSSIFWSSYAQRPHFLVKYFLEQGGVAALWVDPYPTRLPRIVDLRRSSALHRQHTPRLRGLTVIQLGGWPIEPLPGGAWLNRRLQWGAFMRQLSNFAVGNQVIVGVGRPSALALYALEKLRPAWSFYDAMDDFPEFYGGLSRGAMRKRETQIAKSVDVVYASSTGLMKKFESLDVPTTMLSNACDATTLTGTAAQRKGPTVLGYVGTMGKWFDWEMVTTLAKVAPDVEIQLIGPCFYRPRWALPKNIHVLPPCRHDEVVRHLRRFTVGLIPFKKTRLTESVDPVKYYEYRAAGLPILSTSFGEMASRGPGDGVFFLDRGNSVEEALAAAGGCRVDPAAVRVFREQHNWTARFREVGLFQELLKLSDPPDSPAQDASGRKAASASTFRNTNRCAPR